MNKNLCKTVLEEGGDIIPLIISSKDTGGTGLMNPSVFIYNGKPIVNLRHVNYTLWHSEFRQKFNNNWGPLAYLHPENDIHLKTNNFLLFLNDNYETESYYKVNMKLDSPNPMWEFHGLEDARLVYWNNKLYLSGVRRDTTPNGEGRIELSEVIIKNDGVEEVSRLRTEPPGPPSYCEKNWMPILDMPYHYVKWCNPTQVVKVDPISGIAETVYLSNDRIPNLPDFRGGSQVINWMGLKMAFIHQVFLFNNIIKQKDAIYEHRLLLWDNNWNLIFISEPFKFMTGLIEFCGGAAIYKDDLLISFGFQDNSAFILRVPKDKIESIFGFKYDNLKINNKITPKHVLTVEDKLKDFPPVYYISHYKDKERRDILEKQFEEYKIKSHCVLSTEESDRSNIIKGQFIHQLTPWHLNVTASHLKAIKEWYENSSEPYAIIMEDDISLETIKYWNFTWNDLMNHLPSDWRCVQLCLIRDKLNLVSLRRRSWDDWSASAYLINRNYANKLLSTYYVNGEFILEKTGTNLLPITENILFLDQQNPNSIYVMPLFIENEKIKTTYDQENLNIKKNENEFRIHKESSEFVLKWWKDIGKFVDIKNLISL